MRIIGFIIIVLMAISATDRSYANDIDVQFSGFASFALSYTDDSDIGFASNYSNVNKSGFSATRDSILGGQANISLSNNWDSVVQIVIQDHAFKSFDNLTTLSATYSLDAWTMRFSLSRSAFGDYKLTALDEFISSLDSVPQIIWPQAQTISNKFNTEGNSIRYAAFGLTYDYDNWLIQSEMGISESDWIIAPSVLNSYISAGYRVNNAIFYTSFSAAKNRHNVIKVIDPVFSPGTPEQISKPIQQLALAAQASIKIPYVHQHSINVGVKWQLSERLALKAQLDRFDIKPVGAGLWSLSNPADVDKGHKVHVLSLNASMVF